MQGCRRRAAELVVFPSEQRSAATPRRRPGAGGSAAGRGRGGGLGSAWLARSDRRRRRADSGRSAPKPRRWWPHRRRRSDGGSAWKTQALVEQWSKVAYEHMTFDQPDYEMDNGQPRLTDHGTFQGSTMSRSNFTGLLQRHIGQEILVDINLEEADQQCASVSNDVSVGKEFSCSNSQHCSLERVGSVRVRQFTSIHENNALQDQWHLIKQPWQWGTRCLLRTLVPRVRHGSRSSHCRLRMMHLLPP